MSLNEAAGKDLTNEKRVGMVYPTYWLDAPKPVREIVPLLNINPSAYVFIVITCGAQTNNAVWSVKFHLSAYISKFMYICDFNSTREMSVKAFQNNTKGEGDGQHQLSKCKDGEER